MIPQVIITYDEKYLFIFIQGKTKRDILFERRQNTEMNDACAFNLNNQNFIIGGEDNKQQVELNESTTISVFFKISVLNGCSLRIVSAMPIVSYRPACATFDFNSQLFALICFASGYKQTCYK